MEAIVPGSHALLHVEHLHDYKIRIYGTPDNPLFIAADVAKVLDIRNIDEAISGLETYKKNAVYIADMMGNFQRTEALTEWGLQSFLLRISRKPLSKELEKRLLNSVLPAIRHAAHRIDSEIITKQKEEIITLKQENAKLVEAQNAAALTKPESSAMKLREMELENENLRLQIKLFHLQKGIFGEDVATVWINENPPKDKETHVEYYQRYQSHVEHGAPANVFGGCVRGAGYKTVKGVGCRYWTK